MIKKYFLFILVFMAGTALRAQIEGIPKDSISFFLCHNWQEKARFLNGRQVALSGEALRYKFNSDSLFQKEYDKKIVQGTWLYDSDKKVVKLQIEEKTDFFVVLLNSKELLLAAELLEGDKKGLGILVLLHRFD